MVLNMELKIINGKWKLVSENGTSETFFQLSKIKRKEFMILLTCEMILSKHKIKITKKDNKELTLFEEFIQVLKEILFALAEIITKREPKFIDEFDYEIYEHNYWNK
jgi:hypothetical protein